jgi:hypothetical protein
VQRRTVARVVMVSIVTIGVGVHTAWAQTSKPLEIGAQITSVHVGELDSTDVGLGGRVAWHASRLIGVEGELNFYPSDLPDQTPVSRGRVEGLFGITAGPRFNQWRPFARIRPGFLNVQSSPEPVACVLIFPPPLSCGLAAGQTLFALDVGGGVELMAPGRTFLRLDVGDRMVRYPGPAIDHDRNVHDKDFVGHDVRLAIGAGWRF